MLESDTIYFLMSKFLMGTLMFVRVLGFMAAAPLFKNTAVLPQLKIFLAAIIAVMLTSSYWEQQPVIDFHLWYMALLVLKEFFLGAVIGFSARLVFFSARFAGGLIDLGMGYQTSALFDQNNVTPTLIGELKELVVLMLFIYLGGPEQIIETLYASMRAVPLTTFEVTSSSVGLFIKFATTVFIMGLKMAAPVLVALFCTNLALALLARVAPQTNIFILSFQIKVIVGLLVLSVSMPLFIYVAKWALGTLQQTTMEIIMSLNPGRI